MAREREKRASQGLLQRTRAIADTATVSSWMAPAAKPDHNQQLPEPLLNKGSARALIGRRRAMDIRSTLTELSAAFNAHDLDRIMALFADDCILEMPRGSAPWGARFEGKASVRQALASRFEGLPDVHYGNGEHFVDSSAKTGISKWTLTGTTRDGVQKEVRGCDFYTFGDGKVIRKDSYWKIVE